jgi:hypothetical protein
LQPHIGEPPTGRPRYSCFRAGDVPPATGHAKEQAMSEITNVILTHGIFEDHEEGQRRYSIIERLNSLLDRPGLEGRFAQVDSYAGGRRDMQVGVYLCAFEYLLPHKLVEAIESVPWERPNDVQLFMMRQDESRFREVPLFGRRGE